MINTATTLSTRKTITSPSPSVASAHVLLRLLERSSHAYNYCWLCSQDTTRKPVYNSSCAFLNNNEIKNIRKQQIVGSSCRQQNVQCIIIKIQQPFRFFLSLNQNAAFLLSHLTGNFFRLKSSYVHYRRKLHSFQTTQLYSNFNSTLSTFTFEG